MSIRDEIRGRIAEKRLRTLAQAVPAGPEFRRILVTPEVGDLLDGRCESQFDKRRAGVARALLEGFLLGDLVVGRMPPSKNVHTVIALLSPAEDNVWEFRVGEPRPGMRILGRFATRDVFIATNWVRREDFRDPVTGEDDSRRWRDEVVRCKTIWTRLFPSYDPFKGSTLNDFISNSRLPV